jgi:parallel beta-helix repeat protein
MRQKLVYQEILTKNARCRFLLSKNPYKNPFIINSDNNNLVLVVKAQAKCKTVLGFVLMLLLTSVFVSAWIHLAKAEPKTWIVDDDDSAADFSSIQAAINAAGVGDAVYVRAGHYYEHLVIGKTVKLLGENEALTVIDGNFTGDVVTVAAINVEISRFTIQNSGKRIVTDGPPPAGFPLYETMCGVYVSSCTGCNISGNVVSNNFVGLNLESCSNILISENQILNNSGDCGIRVAFSSSVTLSNNKIALNQNCGAVVFQCSASTVTENQIFENLGQGGIVISFTSRFITVSKNNITNNAFQGLNLVNAFENNVFGNNMSGNHYGVCLSGGTSNKVYENYIQDNYYGVAFYDSPKEQAYNNALVNNTNDVYTFISNVSNSSGPFFSPPSSSNPPSSSPPATPSPNSGVHLKILSPTSRLYQIGLYEAAKSIPLTFTVNEPVSWMGYSLDNQANITLTGNTTLTRLLEGSHSIVVYAKDAAGNTYSSDWVYFKVASTPSVSINSPRNATAYTTNNVAVNITAVGPITGVEFIEYRLEGTSYSDVINGTQLGGREIEGSAVLSELPNGNYTLIAIAHAWLTGAVGNSTVYFTVNGMQPSVIPSPNLSQSQSPLSSLSSSLISFSPQPPLKDNQIHSMSLSIKDDNYGKALIFIVAFASISLLVYFKKRIQ